MTYRSKKGQSALEFLITYGWAFLVALIVIGGLAYFGVLDPLSWLPDRCKFGAGEISCPAYVVEINPLSDDGETTNQGTITLKLTNSLGKTVKISNITAYTDQLIRVCCGDTDTNGRNTTGIAPGLANIDERCAEPGVAPLTGEFHSTEFAVTSDIKVASLDPYDDRDRSTSETYVWLEGKSINLVLAGCEFEDQTVQGDKKMRFFVDVEYYPKLDGIAFAKTLRGEIFSKTEK